MRLLFAMFALVLALPAHSARPFVTDDARIVEPQGCQIETYYKHQREFHENEFWFLPACNPWGFAELTLGVNGIDSTQPDDSRAVILQGKTLLKPLEANGVGFALTLGVLQVTPSQAARTVNPYANTIGSFSFLDDRVVLHANLGAIRDNQIHRTRGTWGIGAEILILAPRLYGIMETYGERLEKPTVHGGLRIWIVPNRVQVDSTIGSQHATPFDRRFGTVGLRVLW